MPKPRALAGTSTRFWPSSEDLAPITAEQAGDDAQQRRLAAATGAQQTHELAFLNGQIDTVEGHETIEAFV